MKLHSPYVLTIASLAMFLSCECLAVELFSTTQELQVFTVKKGELEAVATVGRDALAVGFQLQDIDGQRYRFVRFLTDSYQPGWVSERKIVPFNEFVDKETQVAKQQRNDTSDNVPLAVRRQRNANLKKAWSIVDDIIRDNETLPLEKQVPEPYFSRARLWMTIHEYPEATKDYLKALKLSQYNSKYFKEFETAVNRFSLPLSLWDDSSIGASKHYGKGVHAFRSGDYQEALGHFNNAISFDPNRAVYWYYRSITHRRLSDEAEAIFDVLYGAYIERRQEPVAVSREQMRRLPYILGNDSRALTRSLRYIQGNDRVWLRSFRRGDPSSHIIESALAIGVFSVAPDSSVFAVESGMLRQVDTVGTDALAIGFEQRDVEGEQYRFVRFLSEKHHPGWVSEGNLVREDTTDAAEAATDSQEQPSPDELPRAIQNGSAKLIADWLKIDEIIATNESLPPGNRVPEPYFARARLWMQVGEYPAATRDYLRALGYGGETEGELIGYKQYFPEFQRSIDRFSKIPASPAGGIPYSANEHYGKGVHEFRVGNYEDALTHFSNAVSVEPNRALFWYYRGVTHRRLNDDSEAYFDVLYGAFVERRQQIGIYSRDLTRNLRYIQGNDRVWLTSLRLGDPTTRVIEAAIEGTLSESAVYSRGLAR